MGRCFVRVIHLSRAQDLHGFAETVFFTAEPDSAGENVNEDAGGQAFQTKGLSAKSDADAKRRAASPVACALQRRPFSGDKTKRSAFLVASCSATAIARG